MLTCTAAACPTSCATRPTCTSAAPHSPWHTTGTCLRCTGSSSSSRLQRGSCWRAASGRGPMRRKQQQQQRHAPGSIGSLAVTAGVAAAVAAVATDGNKRAAAATALHKQRATRCADWGEYSLTSDRGACRATLRLRDQACFFSGWHDANCAPTSLTHSICCGAGLALLKP